MNFLKKKINKEDGIFKFEINDNETKKVTNFYKESPFPNYKSNDDKSTILDKGNNNYFLIIFLYAIFMAGFSLFGKVENIYLQQLIIIPIIGQMLHFYLDSQLWKFSDKHNRDNTLIYLKKIIK